MCGRFLLSTPAEVIARLFGARIEKPISESWRARYNIAPSQPILAIRDAPGGGHEAVMLRWGLIPFFADDLENGLRTINAKGETVDTRPSYRAAFRKRRCLIPADGFYEWQARPKGGERPMLIRRIDRKPLAMAGLWEKWTKGPMPIESCTILTCPPNSLLKGIHDRMPVLLGAADWDRWLDPTIEDPAPLKGMLVPFAAGELEAFAVSRHVNSPSFDDPSCAEPEQPKPPEQGIFGQAVSKPRRGRKS